MSIVRQLLVNRFFKCAAGACLLASTMLISSGCENDKPLGKGHDFGDNDQNIVVAMGDSITRGGYSGGAPWPARLASMTGKNVINLGVPGAVSGDGVSRVASALKSRKPGFVIIYYGANDAIQGNDPAAVAGNIERMIATVQDAKSIPVVASVAPMSGAREIYNGNVSAINEQIYAVASARGAKVVDINGAIGSNPELYLVDGLHPSDAGEDLIASEFSGLF